MRSPLVLQVTPCTMTRTEDKLSWWTVDLTSTRLSHLVAGHKQPLMMIPGNLLAPTFQPPMKQEKLSTSN
jgi:hypothetical protein